MSRYSIALILASMLVTVGVVSCGDDDPIVYEQQKIHSQYKNLTSEDDVFYNLELLYPQFDWVEYNRVLDNDFVFYFSDADIANGSPFTQFEKADEIRTLRNMGDNARPDRILSIALALSYSEEEWTPITPEDQKYEGETWYQKTMIYNMTVRAEPNMTYTCTDIKALVTIREGEDYGGRKIWRIIRLRDAIAGRSADTLVAGDPHVEQTTWGGIKVALTKTR